VDTAVNETVLDRPLGTIKDSFVHRCVHYS